MKYKIGDKVKLITREKAFLLGNRYSRTGSISVGDVLTITEITTNGDLMFSSSLISNCEYNPKCFKRVGRITWKERFQP